MVRKTEWLNREAADQQQVGRAMTAEIDIPPAALEAAAEDLFHMQYDDSKGSWSDAPEWLKVTIRSEARAACLAMLREWPGMYEGMKHAAIGRPAKVVATPAIILPLPQEKQNEG